MKPDAYLQHVPEIERRIRDLQPDAIVFALGPTGWLLPWIDQRLLRGVTLWTCHDGCRIMPADDLVIMDPAVRGLHPDTTRYEWIVKSRPRRIWIINSAWENKHPNGSWKDHLSPAVHGLLSVQRFRVWNPDAHPGLMKPSLGHGDAEGPMPDTVAISPTGMTTLAWAKGHRRIGIIGADMMQGHHDTYVRRHVVDQFFCVIAKQASEQGGSIKNLSPITSLAHFEKTSWPSPSASSSAPTSGSKPVEPSPSSNTASASMPLATSRSPGCEPDSQVTRSVVMVKAAPGGSE